jgi:hypothetical protein
MRTVADGAWDKLSGRLDTDVISMVMSCSIVNLFNSPGGGSVSCSWAKTPVVRAGRPNTIKTHITNRARRTSVKKDPIRIC